MDDVADKADPGKGTLRRRVRNCGKKCPGAQQKQTPVVLQRYGICFSIDAKKEGISIKRGRETAVAQGKGTMVKKRVDRAGDMLPSSG